MNFLWKNFFKEEDQTTQVILRANPLFSNFNKKEITLLETMVYRRNFAPGEMIIHPGRGIGLYIVVSGKVSIFYSNSSNEPNSNICYLKEGDFFGEGALVRNKQTVSPMSAQAIEESLLLGFFKPNLLNLIEKNPSTGAKILFQLGTILETRLQKALEKISELTTSSQADR